MSQAKKKYPDPRLFSAVDEFLAYAGFLSADGSIETIDGLKKPIRPGVPLTWNVTGRVTVVYDGLGRAWIAHAHFLTREEGWWQRVCDYLDLKRSTKAHVPFADDRAAVEFFLKSGRKLLEQT